MQSVMSARNFRAWKCRLTRCPVQIQVIVSAFNNLAKCVQKNKKYLWAVYQHVLFAFFHVKCFSVRNSVSGGWRITGQKNISGWKTGCFCLPEVVASICKGGFCSLPPPASEKLLWEQAVPVWSGFWPGYSLNSLLWQLLCL